MFKAQFAPMLIQRDGASAIAFYQEAFGAVLLRRWDNDDGSVHVAELSVGEALFHLRQEGLQSFSPQQCGGVTCIVELFTADPDDLFTRALNAGATQRSAMQNYDYGYRQGILKDPFGHQWIIEKVL